MNWKEDVRAALALAQGHLSAPNAPTSVIIIFKGKGTFSVQLAGKPFLKPKKGKALTGLAEALAAAVAQGQGDQFSVPGGEMELANAAKDLAANHPAQAATLVVELALMYPDFGAALQAELTVKAEATAKSAETQP